MGRYLDEFVRGEVLHTPGRTITETDVVIFAAMSGDYNELHTNEEFARANPFGRRIVHGLLGLAVAHGLLFRTGVLENTSIAFLGVEEWKFLAPVYFGDTLTVRATVAEARISKSKPDRGVVRFFIELVKQDQTVVQTGYQSIMVKCNPERTWAV